MHRWAAIIGPAVSVRGEAHGTPDLKFTFKFWIGSMILVDWFNPTTAKAFGVELADSFIEAVPIEAKLSAKKFEHRAEAVLKRMDRRIIEFKGKNKLNLYKKAQLGNAFKWRLKDATYDDSYIDVLTEWLMERL